MKQLARTRYYWKASLIILLLLVGISLRTGYADGAATVELLKDINVAGLGSSPEYLVDVTGTLFFSAYYGISGIELWKSDGTEAGTVRVKDIYPGSGSSAPNYLTDVNGTLFFSAYTPLFGQEVWIYTPGVVTSGNVYDADTDDPIPGQP